ncbi:hypothetical protein GCM10027258_93410 [Amycolatopsis stemonae]
MTDRHDWPPMPAAHCVPDMPRFIGWGGAEPVTRSCSELFGRPDVYTSSPEFGSRLYSGVDVGVPANAVRFVVEADVPASPVRRPRRHPRRTVTHIAAWLRTLGPDTPNRRLARIVRQSKARRRRQARHWHARPRSMSRALRGALRAAVAGTAAMAATLAVVTACSTSSSPTRQSPDTAPAPSTTGMPTVPFGGAPAVAHPLPRAVLGGEPCADTLTPAQVRAVLGVDVAGQPDVNPLVGPDCTWSAEDDSSVVGVAYRTSAGTGLSGVYAHLRQKAYSWRAVPTIDGFPAVTYSGRGGAIQLSAGLGDQYAIDVLYKPAPGKETDAEQVLCEIAAAVVSRLRGSR